MEEERYLTVAQIAATLQVRPELVRLWLRSGRLRGTKFADRTGYRVKPSDLEDFLRRRRSGEAAA